MHNKGVEFSLHASGLGSQFYLILSNICISHVEITHMYNVFFKIPLIKRYVSKVTIQDLQTRQVYHFFCDCWMSADHGDGMIKKTFNAAKSNEVASFRWVGPFCRCWNQPAELLVDWCQSMFFSIRNIFQTRTSTGFRDEHIWVSIVDPPSHSPFTRAQRVSCCMSLLLCTMAINIAFWNIPVNEDSPVLFSIGELQRRQVFLDVS